MAEDDPGQPGVNSEAPGALHAAEEPIPAQRDRDTLTGDWGGARTRLADAGIRFRGDYVSETFAAVDGGLRRGSAYTQQVRLGAYFDMDRIAGWSGGTFHITFNDRRGKAISSDFVGNRLPIQEAYGGQYCRLSEFSIEQNLAGGKPFAGDTTDVLLPFEVEYAPGSVNRRALPGHYKVGFYNDTSHAPRQGEIGTVKGRHGFYILADQMILREGVGGRSLSLFGQFTINPQASAHPR